MSTDLRNRDLAPVRVPVTRHRRRSLVLMVLALFQFWLWGTRIYNLLRDAEEFSTAFVGVHLVLYAVAVGAGAVLAVLGVRMWRESRDVMDVRAS